MSWELKIAGRRLLEFRNRTTGVSNPAQWFIEAVGGGKSKAGVQVTPKNAEQLSAVYACVRVLAEAIASLPLNVYRYDKEGNRSVDRSHPLNLILHNQPNRIMPSFIYRETAMRYLLLWGNHYAIIHRDVYGQTKELEIVEPTAVTVLVGTEGDIYYQIDGKKYQSYEVLHIPALGDGYVGLSPIQVQSESLGLGIALQNFGAEFFANGASFPGYLKYPQQLKPEQVDQAQDAWGQQTGYGKKHKTPIVHGGAEYIAVGVPPETAQFLDSRKYSREEIAGWFRVPLNMIGDESANTTNNIEHKSINFVKYTLLPWVKRWEGELEKKLLTEEEKQSGMYEIRFNMEGLLRGDVKTRGEYYKVMQQIGALSLNDIRKLENMNAIEGGDRHFVPMNYVPLDKVDEYLESNAKVDKNSIVKKGDNNE